MLNRREKQGQNEIFAESFFVANLSFLELYYLRFFLEDRKSHFRGNLTMITFGPDVLWLDFFIVKVYGRISGQFQNYTKKFIENSYDENEHVNSSRTHRTPFLL